MAAIALWPFTRNGRYKSGRGQGQPQRVTCLSRDVEGPSLQLRMRLKEGDERH